MSGAMLGLVLLCPSLWASRLHIMTPFDGQRLSWDPHRTTMRVRVAVDAIVADQFRTVGTGVSANASICFRLHAFEGELCTACTVGGGHMSGKLSLLRLDRPVILEHLPVGEYTLSAEIRRAQASGPGPELESESRSASKAVLARGAASRSARDTAQRHGAHRRGPRLLLWQRKHRFRFHI